MSNTDRPRTRRAIAARTQPKAPPAPDTPEKLQSWIQSTLGVTIPAHPLAAGSDAPLDYLVHTFFEGGAALPGGAGVPPASAGPPAGESTQLPPADCVLWANRGGGKTFLGALATVLDLVFKKNIQVRILGGSLEQSRRMHRHLRRFFEAPTLAPLLDPKHPVTDSRIRLWNGSAAEVLAASETSVRGTRIQKLRCDEVDLFSRSVWEAAQLTTRSMPCPGPWGDTVRGAVEALSTMHRPLGLMWEVVQDSEQHRPERRPENEQRTAKSEHPEDGSAGPARPRRLFRWGVVDCLAHCPPSLACQTCTLFPECRGRAKERPREAAGHMDVLDAVAMKARVGQAAWESEMLCLRPSRSDAVYPEFDADVHVIDGPTSPPPASHTVFGMDFGFREPTVVLRAAVSPDGVLRILEERVLTETRLQRHIEWIHDAVREAAHAANSDWLIRAGFQNGGAGGQEMVGVGGWVAVDPAGLARTDQTGMSNVTAMRRAGLVVRWRPSSLCEGIALVRARLRPASGPPRLFIHRRCPRLIESLARYRFPEDNPASLVPVKDGHDHAADALRYLVLNLDRPQEETRQNYAA